MDIGSLLFLLFIICGVLIYYSVPEKCKWIILFIMSLIFYSSYRISTLCFVLFAAFSTYYCTGKIEQASEKDVKKKYMRVGVVSNFAILGIVKYVNWLIDGLNSIALLENKGLAIPGINIIAPLGISFYTFQVTGYILDVYWGKDRREDNFFKCLLFTSYFPQIIQGPISKHKTLAAELFREHKFLWFNIERGIILILWGYMKKMVVADTLAVAVSQVFDTTIYYGIDIVVGVLCYCVQLYCDFSGGIDVIRGVSYLFDVEMAENFRQPFFSKSIAEFWRRWHITLGLWMKDYVFYPMSLSKWMNRFGKKCKKLFGNKIGRKLPICLANIVIFFIVGVWHGAAMNFIMYGLYNGFIIAISSLLADVYDWLYAMTKVKRTSPIMGIWQIVRTFILVNIGWFFDRSTRLSGAFSMMKRAFVHSTSLIVDGEKYLGLYKFNYIYALFGIALIMCVSVAKEKEIDVIAWISRRHMLVKLAIYTALFCMIPIMGYFSLDSSQTGGFIYANF